jgi:hypothetical protein
LSTFINESSLTLTNEKILNGPGANVEVELARLQDLRGELMDELEAVNERVHPTKMPNHINLALIEAIEGLRVKGSTETLSREEMTYRLCVALKKFAMTINEAREVATIIKAQEVAAIKAQEELNEQIRIRQEKELEKEITEEELIEWSKKMAKMYKIPLADIPVSRLSKKKMRHIYNIEMLMELVFLFEFVPDFRMLSTENYEALRQFMEIKKKLSLKFLNIVEKWPSFPFTPFCNEGRLAT